jgi:hypothetical protein
MGTEFTNETLADIRNLLQEEANVLARLSDSKAFSGMDHRVGIAISREMRRLRMMAEEIEAVDAELNTLRALKK